MGSQPILWKNKQTAKNLNKKPRNQDGLNIRRLNARKRTMRIGTWNAQSINNKFEEILEELYKQNVDIAAISETKKKGTGIEEKLNYVHIFTGVRKEERAQSGVSIVIHKKLKRCIKSWDYVNDRIIQVDITLLTHDVVIFGVYAPNDDAAAHIKDKFYDEMTKLLDRTSNRKEVIILGDLNGRVGSRDDDPVIGRFGEITTNNNGDRLIEFCHTHKIRVMNGWFKHKDIHRYTWTQPTRQLKSIIDYVILKQDTKLFVHDVKVKRGAECGSDHHLLVAKIHYPYKGLGYAKQNDLNNQANTFENNQPVYNLAALENDDTKFLYQLRLANSLPALDHAATIEETYNIIKTCIQDTAKEIIGVKAKLRRGSILPPWWSADIACQIELKKAAYKKWLSSHTIEDKELYRTLRKEVQKSVNKAKTDLWKDAGKEINKCVGNTRASKAWQILKSLRTQNINRSNINLISTDTWLQYYKDLLSETRKEFLNEEPQDDEIQSQEIIPDLTVDEVYKCLCYMKNGKASGPGNIPIELIKAGPLALTELITRLMNKCIAMAVVPEDWKKAVITSIHKKGDRKDCRNYRGISVISSLARLYGKVLKLRIEEKINTSEEQNGFRAGRSCIDGIFSLKQLMEKKAARRQPVHMIFVDLKKAYDTVPLNKLWDTLINSGVPKTYVSAVKSLYSNCSSKIRVGNRVSQEFLTTKGLRQGCALAPTLFKIYLEGALKTWRDKCSGMGIRINDDHLYTLLFADDQVLVANDEYDVRYMFRKLKEEYQKWGLEVNTSKTEYLVVGDNAEDLSFDDYSLKNRNTFKYLGVTLSSTTKSKEDILNKIGQGRRAIRQLNPVLWNDKITKTTKRTIYKTIVESITTYGSETWELNKYLRSRLCAVEMDFWRRSCRVSRLEHIKNEEIRRRMNIHDTILDTIEQKRLIWYGHLQRMNQERWPKKIFEWIPTGNRRPGRPSRTWLNEVTEAMETRGLLDGDWRDRKQWRLRCEKRRQP